MGTFKWLFLAMALCMFAIIIMIAGLLRNNKLVNKLTDTEEEAEGNRLLGKKIFTRHALISAVLIAVAAVITFTLGRGA